MVNAGGDFVDFYALWESVVTATRHTGQRHAGFNLKPEYMDAASNRLASLGLPDSAWFVAFHTRTLGYPNDPRSVDPVCAIAAIQEVLLKGGFVVSFGTTRREPLVKHHRYLELSSLSTNQEFLHPYLLEKAEFLITTNSGPAVVAHVLGTDLLQFNTTSIARNSLSSWATSYYLPAVPVDRYGRDRSPFEMFQDASAWWEPNPGSRTARRFRFRRNTSEEILAACQDLLLIRNLSDVGHLPDEAINSVLDRRRQEAGAVSFGDFAPSFLAQWRDCGP